MKMKRILLMATVAVLPVAANSAPGSVIFGNYLDFSENSSHTENFLLGSPISINQPVTLSAAGIVFRSVGYDGNIGIYSDSGGHPSQLLASTGPFLVSSLGHVEVPFSSVTVVGPGTFWFMAVFDAQASVGIRFGDSTDVVDYRDLSFTANLPATFGPATEYTQQGFNYYLVAEVPEPCGLFLHGFVWLAAGSLSSRFWPKR